MAVGSRIRAFGEPFATSFGARAGVIAEKIGLGKRLDDPEIGAMQKIFKQSAVVLAGAMAIAGIAIADDAAKKKTGWVTIFDGKSLDGWTSNEENKGSFKVVKGELKVSGKRAHLFYSGKVNNAEFTNFELKAKVKTEPKANSGIYFHTKFQKSGWPSKGYECQVNNTHSDRKKTGGLYAIKDVLDKAPAKDGEWFDYHIKVNGKRITISINGKVTSDYTEPENPKRPGSMKGRVLDKGTFCIQAHDPGSVIYYKDIAVKVLP